MIEFDARRRIWLLSTPTTAYALRLDEDGTPRHVHWGRPLTLEQAAAVPPFRDPADSSFEHPRSDGAELPVAGFGPPALQIRFPGGGREIEWRCDGHTVEGGHLTIRLHDRRRPLAAELHYRVHEDGDVLERWTVLRHTGGDAPLEVLRVDSAAWSVPHLAGYRLSHVTGAWGSEFRLRREALPGGETVLTSRRGVSGHHANPWLMIDDGGAGEEHGEVWSTALAWSGSWRITLHRSPAERLGWSGGFGHDGVTWRLEPGASLETPVFAGLYRPDGFGGTSRSWHAYIARHVLPAGSESRPVVYNSWEATGWAVTEEGQKRLAALAAEIGAEMFVMDDGWFGARDSDEAGLGDWVPNPGKFPTGLDGLIAEVRRLGMRFGIWVEPEMVNPDSDLYRAHPDWVLHEPGRSRTLLRNQLVLDFGRPEVVSWAHDWLDRLVGAHRIDFLKWDMNRALTEVGRPGAGDPGRPWIDHVRGVYEVMDRLRADHPRLRIETCAGGGGRVDLGVLRRADEAWTSDNTDAADRIGIQHGFGQIYPARTMAAWVTDSPNFLTGRDLPLRFRFHVAMAGVLGVGGDLSRWSAAEREEAAELVALYKEIRPVVQHGVHYRLGEPPLTGVQYVADGRVVVLAWRLSSSFGAPPAPLRLRALDPDARYRDDDTGAVHHGAVLLAHGLPLELPGRGHASALVRLTRVE